MDVPPPDAYAAGISSPRDTPDAVRLAQLVFALANAGDYERVLELVHPDIEATLKVRPGEVLQGREAVASFFREVADERSISEAIVSDIHALDEGRVVVEGRMRWMDENLVLRDDPVVWALEFDDGLLRRSIPTRSVTEAEALLSSPSASG